MKMIKILGIVTVFAATPLHAQIQQDVWSAAGGAWTMENQPGFTPGVGGTLNPDASADNGAEMAVTGATSGIYTDYYYTFFSTPAFTISTTNVLSGIETIQFEFLANRTFTLESVSLDFNGLQTPISFSSQPGGTLSGFAVNLYTWTWEVGSLGEAGSFSLSWATPQNHNAYEMVSLTQSVTAVPEPYEYGLAMAALLLFVVIARRRRAA